MVVQCYLNINIEDYLSKFKDYISDDEKDTVRMLIKNLPESLDDLKRYALKYVTMEYLFSKLSEEEINSIKNHFKKIPENFMEWAEKNYLSATVVDELNKKVKNIVKPPEEFIAEIKNKGLISDNELKEFEEEVKKILERILRN
jgi:DNA topoisomerase-6 subunit B